MKQTIKTDAASLRSFAYVMALMITLISLLFYLRRHVYNEYVLMFSGIFLILGSVWPASLKYLYIGWMKLAKIIALFNTTLILSLIYYVVFTPIGLIMRIFKPDMLEKKFNPGTPSYWAPVPVELKTKEDYERLS